MKLRYWAAGVGAAVIATAGFVVVDAPANAAPAAVTCITAKATATNKVKLDWNDTIWADGSTNRRYEVHEDLYNGTDNLVTTVQASARTSGVIADGDYEYYVIAKDSTGKADPSPKVTVHLPGTAKTSNPNGCDPTVPVTPTPTTTPTTTTDTTTPTTTTRSEERRVGNESRSA